MTWGGRARRVVRLGGAAQLILATAVAASFLATLAGPLWRQSRPGCVVSGMVTCTPSGIDLAGRWPGAAVGALLALVVAMSAGRVRRSAQALVLVVMSLGTAVFAADQQRWAGARRAVCSLGRAGGCVYPAWHTTDLFVGAAVGVVLGLLALAMERVGRRAPHGAVGPGRTAVRSGVRDRDESTLPAFHQGAGGSGRSGAG